MLYMYGYKEEQMNDISLYRKRILHKIMQDA